MCEIDEIVRRISREHPGGGSLVTILKNMRWQAATEGASMVFLLDSKDSLVSPKDIWTIGLNENLWCHVWRVRLCMFQPGNKCPLCGDGCGSIHHSLSSCPNNMSLIRARHNGIALRLLFMIKNSDPKLKYWFDESFRTLPVDIYPPPPSQFSHKRPDLIFAKQIGKNRFQLTLIEVSTGCSTIRKDLASIIRDKSANYVEAMDWMRKQKNVHSVNFFVFLLTPALLMPKKNEQIMKHFKLKRTVFEKVKDELLKDSIIYNKFIVGRRSADEMVPRELATPIRLVLAFNLLELRERMTKLPIET